MKKVIPRISDNVPRITKKAAIIPNAVFVEIKFFGKKVNCKGLHDMQRKTEDQKTSLNSLIL